MIVGEEEGVQVRQLEILKRLVIFTLQVESRVKTQNDRKREKVVAKWKTVGTRCEDFVGNCVRC